MCFCWGVVTTLQSQVHNFGGLVTCRFFLGLFEGGLLPGIILYLSGERVCSEKSRKRHLIVLAGFYRRHELQLRVCLFFCAAALAGAFSGLLAAAIASMDGVGGMEGWRW
jgi:MFS family permease